MKEKIQNSAEAKRSRERYKLVRDRAWRMLLKHRVRALPVDVFDVCRREGIRVMSYRAAAERGLLEVLGGVTDGKDGFALVVRGKKLIFYDDTLSIGRQRFTVAHELGHFAMGDVGAEPTARNVEPSDKDSDTERLANMFAARLLSPACVLWGLGVRSAEEIAEICGLSRAASEWRFKRLMELYERERGWLAQRGRSCFLSSTLEAKVYSRFERFIKTWNRRSD